MISEWLYRIRGAWAVLTGRAWASYFADEPDYGPCPEIRGINRATNQWWTNAELDEPYP